MSDLKFVLPEEVKYIIGRLSENGYRADVVGGPVRDLLLGKEPYDYDITTSATPDEVKACFPDFRTVDTGIKHGTVTLVINKVGYEITTYRIDGEYLDSRHPESVSFTTELSLDLSRRDFTMNAIAYSEKYGITDLHSGREDIEAGIIRAVGDPDIRFHEDALRILRAIRFASALGFSLEKSTDSAVRSCASLLRGVSAERIYSEWIKLISGKDRYRILADYSDVISVFLPELFTGEKGDLSLMLPDGENRSDAHPLILMLALFRLNIKERAAAAYKQAMIRLHTDVFTRDTGTLALTAIGGYATSSRAGILRLMMDLGRETAELVIDTEILLGITSRDSRSLLDAIIKERAPYRPSDLDVNGNDLIELGYSGAEIGKAMRLLLIEVIDGAVKNDRASLMARLRKMSKNG